MNPTYHIQCILAPIDASEQRDRVLSAAAAMARSTQASVQVVHVDADVPALDTDADSESPGAASALVAAAVRELQAEGISADGAVMHGANADIDDLLLIEARRIGADLIVLGANHRTGLSALLEASVTDDVARHADVLVLLVP
jgi:nucleotide-binding universal stress UspA family protein